MKAKQAKKTKKKIYDRTGQQALKKYGQSHELTKATAPVDTDWVAEQQALARGDTWLALEIRHQRVMRKLEDWDEAIRKGHEELMLKLRAYQERSKKYDEISKRIKEEWFRNLSREEQDRLLHEWFRDDNLNPGDDHAYQAQKHTQERQQQKENDR